MVINARWTVRAGCEDAVATALSELAEVTRAEPGCLYYVPYRSPDEPSVFRIFEVYRDDAALHAHRQSDHFKRLVEERAAPLLAERERAVFETLTDGDAA